MLQLCSLGVYLLLFGVFVANRRKHGGGGPLESEGDGVEAVLGFVVHTPRTPGITLEAYRAEAGRHGRYGRRNRRPVHGNRGHLGIALPEVVDHIASYGNGSIASRRHTWCSQSRRGGCSTDRPGGRARSEERRVGKECRSRWSPY